MIRNGKVIYQTLHRVGYEVYPTQVWQKGDVVRDQVWFHWPGGDYKDLSLEISVYKGSEGGAFKKVQLFNENASKQEAFFVLNYNQLKGPNDGR